MFKTYSDIFDKRGEAYHQAMYLNPDARNLEFAAVLGQAKLTNGLVICDMPSGGGYLQDKLPSNLNIQLISIESSRQFLRKLTESNSGEAHLCPLHATSLGDESVDRIFSIAGLHHLDSRLDVFVEMSRILRKGGRLCILEVPEGAITDLFLNEFVHEHNHIGHTGIFIDMHFREELSKAGFILKTDELRSYTWNFTDVEQMVRYVQLMFGIDMATEDEILAGISHYLGYTCSPTGCHMNWELQLICADLDTDRF